MLGKHTQSFLHPVEQKHMCTQQGTSRYTAGDIQDTAGWQPRHVNLRLTERHKTESVGVEWLRRVVDYLDKINEMMYPGTQVKR